MNYAAGKGAGIAGAAGGAVGGFAGGHGKQVLHSAGHKAKEVQGSFSAGEAEMLPNNKQK